MGSHPSLLFADYPFLLLQLSGSSAYGPPKWTRTLQAGAMLPDRIVFESRVAGLGHLFATRVDWCEPAATRLDHGRGIEAQVLAVEAGDHLNALG